MTTRTPWPSAPAPIMLIDYARTARDCIIQARRLEDLIADDLCLAEPDRRALRALLADPTLDLETAIARWAERPTR